MAIARPDLPAIPSAPTPERVAAAIARVPRAFAFRYDALPLDLVDGTLTIALPDTGAVDVVDLLRNTTRLRIRPVALMRETIRERLRTAYGADLSSTDRRDANSPAVRAVDKLFEAAIVAHASDIHIEPATTGGRVRLRVDGILRDADVVPNDLFAALTSRIKLLAGMDIADRRTPQDGRYTALVGPREIDARVASVPTIDGEKLVVRLLDHHTRAPRLGELGMPPEMLAAYRKLADAPWGFIVVCGPTGSGKTTTLYASLVELDSQTRNICSVEDPIEMRLPGVSQVQVNVRAGLTFPIILRSFMRQDPNVIMVGEMRDVETAAVGVSAALSGQAVFTTVHSNDAPRTIDRLVELGVSRHSLAAALTGVVAQRLLRRLCEHCRLEELIPADIARALGVTQRHWFMPGGCRACGGSGYSGRTGVYELLVVDDDIRDAIANGSSSVHVAGIAHPRGYRAMIADGIAKLLAGETSYPELRRVVSWTDG